MGLTGLSPHQIKGVTTKYLIATALAVELVIYLIVVGLIVGLLLFLVARAPFIPPEWKTWINYIIYFVVVLIVINFLLGLTGHPLVNMR